MYPSTSFPKIVVSKYIFSQSSQFFPRSNFSKKFRPILNLKGVMLIRFSFFVFSEFFCGVGMAIMVVSGPVTAPAKIT